MDSAGRQTICVEGPDHPVDGVTIEIGALTWDEGILPLAGTHRSSIMGHVSDVRREDGIITAELHIDDEKRAGFLSNLPYGWGWTIYADHVERSDGSKNVVAGRIRSVFLAPDLPWGSTK